MAVSLCPDYRYAALGMLADEYADSMKITQRYPDKLCIKHAAPSAAAITFGAWDFCRADCSQLSLHQRGGVEALNWPSMAALYF